MALTDKEAPLSVTQAVRIAAGHVDAIPRLTVTGEVSGYRGPNARGHCYFSLKDSECSVSVIIWAKTFEAAGIELKDGLEIQATGKFEVYPNTGKLSMVIYKFSVAGEGLLRQQVAELARRLRDEGLMDEARKRPIPPFCSRVCVVTSLTGSVIEDVRRTLDRRNRLVELDVVGCQVQGKQAPPTIIRALRAAAATAPDAILLVRGGGSYEDLMCFNDEAVARAVAASPVPVITGIGHEPDTSICDMVADRRCSTPTAAAESVAPAINELETLTNQRGRRLNNAMRSLLLDDEKELEAAGARASRAMEGKLTQVTTYLEGLASRSCLSDPLSMISSREDALLLTEQRLHDAIPRSLERSATQLDRDAERLTSVAAHLLRPFETVLGRSAASLEALSPLKVLGRGYAITRDGQGHVVSSADQVAVGERVSVMLGSGSIDACVERVRQSD